MRRLYGTLVPDNTRSHRMHVFLGYVDEGRRRGHWMHPEGFVEDLLEIGLLAEEFEAQRPKIEGKLYAKAPVPDISAESAERIREWFAARGPAFLR